MARREARLAWKRGRTKKRPFVANGPSLGRKRPSGLTVTIGMTERHRACRNMSLFARVGNWRRLLSSGKSIVYVAVRQHLANRPHGSRSQLACQATRASRQRKRPSCLPRAPRARHPPFRQLLKTRASTRPTCRRAILPLFPQAHRSDRQGTATAPSTPSPPPTAQPSARSARALASAYPDARHRRRGVRQRRARARACAG